MSLDDERVNALVGKEEGGGETDYAAAYDEDGNVW